MNWKTLYKKGINNKLKSKELFLKLPQKTLRKSRKSS